MRRIASFIVVCVACLAMVGCGGSIGDFFERVFVSPTRSVVEALNRTVRIEIPRDTFTRSVTFLLANVLGLPTIGNLLVVNAIDFNIEGQTPGRDLKLRVNFDPSRIPPGVLADQLRLYRVEGTRATLIPGSVVDTTENFVEGPVDGNATYVVGHEPPQP